MINATNNPTPLTVIILTYNESINLPQALRNVCGWAEQVFILDSGSTDDTCSIAEGFGAQVFYRPFDNYALQRNYAIKELPIATEWMMFLDADEFLTEALKEEISALFARSNEVAYDAYYLKRRFYFHGSWIRWGGYYPIWLLRLFKPAKATCEREINEHIVVEGKIGYLKNDFVDNNLKSVTEWIDKHNRYATMEAEQFKKANKLPVSLWGSQSERKQWIRQWIWNRMLPPLVRPLIYFFYRYFLRLGFLDGKAGFQYHFLHGLWYKMLIDIKYLEKKRENQQEFD